MQNPQSRVLDYHAAPSPKKKEQVLRDYEPMIHHIIQKKNLYGEFQDLMQEGRIALMKALDTYSPEKSKFSSYAFTVIKNRLFSYVKRNNTTVNGKGHGGIYMVGDGILEVTPTYDKTNEVKEEIFALIGKMRPRQQYWIRKHLNGEKPQNHSQSELTSRAMIKLRGMVKNLRLSRDDLAKALHF